RICFKVSNKSDSRVVLDEMGGEKLLGKGDMLFLPPGTSTLVRAQGTYAGDGEIEGVVDFLECEPCYAQELMQLNTAEREGAGARRAGPDVPGKPDDLPRGQRPEARPELAIHRPDEPRGDEPLPHRAGVDAVGEEEVVEVVAGAGRVDGRAPEPDRAALGASG